MLPHLLHCFICTRNAMSIALLLQFMGGGLGGGGGGSCFILSVGGETEGGYHLTVFVLFS